MELAVATVILVVLATLVVAVSSEASRKADNLKCLSNLRILANAGRLFANDFNGNFTHRRFMHDAAFLNNTTQTPEPGLREYAGRPQRSVGVDTVFTCPILQKHYPVTRYAENRNYVINRFATSDYASATFKFSTVPQPSAMAYLMDGPMPDKEADGYAFATHIVPGDATTLLAPHGGQNFVVFVDGHAEGLTREQILAFTAKSAFWRGDNLQ